MTLPNAPSFQPFAGKTIAIGICGGIAAYRACDLIRELYRQGASQVICLLTKHATDFVTETTLHALSKHPVYRHDASVDVAGNPVHIKLAQEADLLLVLPATANTIAKCAQGLADDIISTTFITFTNKPVVFAPAMNTRMWRHPIFQENLAKLASLENISIVPPSVGYLACGETGEGHLASQDVILQYAYRALHPHQNLLQGKKILVTAGGTEEAIDPVRCISNHSSGKMGVALADEAWAMGADVTLITSKPNIDRPYAIESFKNSNELNVIASELWPQSDWLIMAAAVSDFLPAEPAKQKIKKHASKPGILNLALLPNGDILEGLGKIKQPHQRLIGFAAESHDLLENAREKMRRKNLDAIVVNDISRQDIGFQSNDNEVTLLLANGESIHLNKAPKASIAQTILQLLQTENKVATNTSLTFSEKIKL